MYLRARVERLDLDRVKALRKDFLTLMKNTKVVKDYDQAVLWRGAVDRWRKAFNDYIYKKLLPAIERLDMLDDEQVKGWRKQISRGVWGLATEFKVPLDRGAKSDYDKEVLFGRFQRELPKWDRRIRRLARDAWTTLQNASDQLRTPAVYQPEVTTLSGFRVTLEDFDPHEEMAMEDLGRFERALGMYRDRAQKVLPLLLRAQLPITIDFTPSFRRAGVYKGDRVVLFVVATRGVRDVVMALAHEMGHHLYLNYLSDQDKGYWSGAIAGELGTLDLREVLAKYGRPYENPYDSPTIRQADPILYLQLRGLYDHPSSEAIFENIHSMADIRVHLERGGQAVWEVHGKPITGLARMNDEEAFCEAVGSLVAYGPQALLPEVRQWLQIILPTVRVAASSRGERSKGNELRPHSGLAPRGRGLRGGGPLLGG